MNLQAKIDAGLAGISTAVEQAIIDAVVKREIEKRSTSIVTVYDKMMREQKDLNKINRPDQATYNADRSKASETYSKERLDAIEKSTKAIEKMSKAIEKALSSGDFSDVYNLTGNATQ